MSPDRSPVRACAVCDNPNENRVHSAREMMYGSGEPFSYLECSSCGTVQLLDQPRDIGTYYPSDYYSFSSSPAPVGRLERRLRRARAALALRLPRSVVRRWSRLDPGVQVMWLHGHASTRSAVLDVGSGSGHNLQVLWREGFDNLLGYDPFAPDDDGPVKVVTELPVSRRGTFDVVMMNHAFEHVPDPLSQLRELRTWLRPNGRIMLRVPLADSYAWRHYGVNWVQLDPPRHFWLFSAAAIEQLAKQAGLRVIDSWRDSTPFQFWGSDAYARGIPLSEATPPADLAPLTERARQLNAAGEGDQGVFWLASR